MNIDAERSQRIVHELFQSGLQLAAFAIILWCVVYLIRRTKRRWHVEDVHEMQQEQPTQGKLLVRARRKSMMTRAYVAQQLNVPEQTVRRWERNLEAPTQLQLTSLAHLFRIPPAELIAAQPPKGDDIP